MAQMTDEPIKDDDQAPADNLDELSADLEALQAENDRLKELAARAQADLQNAKIRLNKEAGDSRRFAAEGLLQTLLPTVDNFQRAFAHLPEDLKDNDWIKGLQAIEQSFMKDLQATGLQKMDSKGKKADPAYHEVLQAGSGEDGIITEVFEEGYTLHDKVLRPAKVKVGDGSSESVNQ